MENEMATKKVNVSINPETMKALTEMRLRISQDLGFTPEIYGFGAGIFFFGYFFFEVPSNLMLEKVGARAWMCRIMVSWGVLSMACAFVQGATSFYALRFLLGAAEAGLYPGMILYMTYWFPQSTRARFIALFLGGVPLSAVIGGPLSGWILGLGDMHGLHSCIWHRLTTGIFDNTGDGGGGDGGN